MKSLVYYNKVYLLRLYYVLSVVCLDLLSKLGKFFNNFLNIEVVNYKVFDWLLSGFSVWVGGYF